MPTRDVIIVGAGPSGLAAAIACERRGLDYEVLERGVLVNSIFNFPPQMVFFTTPELLEIGGLPFVSPFDRPTRVEALRYYRRVVDTCKLKLSMVPCHDPDTFETDVPNVFLAGGVIVGVDTAPVFIENGRLHGEKVVGLIASRLGR